MISMYENELPMAVRNDGKKSVKEYSQIDWGHKVKEELTEVLTAGSPEEQAEEIGDIITVCTSWLESIGYDLAARKQLFRAINVKNNDRGYFDMMG